MANPSQSSGPGPGGFFPPQTLPSPAPSSSSTIALSRVGLPHPRAKPLPSGSSKEEVVRRFVDERMAIVSRRYVKKHGNAEPGDQVIGYKSFAELCKDLHTAIDVLWLSGTPSLQIPFLLTIASGFNMWIDAFPPSPKATFSVLTKLDHCFASLLIGRDIETNEPLPGFENGMRAGMSTTDMVRCRSCVEQTRQVVLEVLSKEPDDEDEMEEVNAYSDTITGNETDNDEAFDSNWDQDDDRLYMDVARVYEHTIVRLGEKLGDVLGAPPQAPIIPPGCIPGGSDQF